MKKVSFESGVEQRWSDAYCLSESCDDDGDDLSIYLSIYLYVFHNKPYSTAKRKKTVEQDGQGWQLLQLP